MKKQLAVFLLLTAGVCSWARPFPLCMYGVNNAADLPTLKKAGFTCIQSYQKDPEKLSLLAAAAQKHGMQVVFYPDQIIGTTYQDAAQHWPVLAWYLVDEPDVWKWDRERVFQTHEQTRRAFPQHQTTLVIGQGKTRVAFYDLPDNLMVDWYPVPHLALTSFGDQVALAKQGQTDTHAAHKPLWGVVQIFDWKEFKQHRPDKDRIGRFPTKEEIRFMSYDGIINGAEGLFYFTFNTKGHPLPSAQPQWWRRIKAVSKELSALRPALENGVLVANPIEVSAPLALQTRLYKKHFYVFLLNRSAAPVTVPQALLDKSYKMQFSGKKSTQIPAHTVWVLKKTK